MVMEPLGGGVAMVFVVRWATGPCPLIILKTLLDAVMLPFGHQQLKGDLYIMHARVNETLRSQTSDVLSDGKYDIESIRNACESVESRSGDLLFASFDGGHENWGLASSRLIQDFVPSFDREWQFIAGASLIERQHVETLRQFIGRFDQSLKDIEGAANFNGIQAHLDIGPITHNGVGLCYSWADFTSSHLLEQALSEDVWYERIRDGRLASHVPALGCVTYLPPDVVGKLGGHDVMAASLEHWKQLGLVDPSVDVKVALRPTGRGGLVVVLDERLERLVGPPVGPGDYSVAAGVGVWLAEQLDARRLRI